MVKRQLSNSMVLAGDKTNIAHNNREEKETKLKKNSHINKDKTKENVYLKQESIEKKYEEIFGESLERYNNKQKRNDRKIDNYYEHVKNSKKTIEQREMIVQVGTLQDIEEGNMDPEEAKEMLEEWFEGFEERNPNLKVYNAVIHMDEATPHLHLNFIPVGEGYKRGMDKQVAFDRALSQQSDTFDKSKPFPEWRDKEIGVMEDIMGSRDIERKEVGTHSDMTVDQYKNLREREKAVEKIEKEQQRVTKSQNNRENRLDEREKKVNNKIIQVNKQVQDISRVNNSLKARERAVEKAEEENSKISKDLDIKALETQSKALEAYGRLEEADKRLEEAEKKLQEAKESEERAKKDRELANKMLKRSEDVNERTKSIYIEMKNGQDVSQEVTLLAEDIENLEEDNNIKL